MLQAPPAPGGSRLSPTVRTPRASRVTDVDIAAVVGVLTFLVVAMWTRHGGLTALGHGWADASTSLTQVSGLAASGVGLAGLALVGRPRSLERRYGLDRLFIWHRILGETMAVLVGVHVTASLVAWSADGGWLGAVQDLTGRQPYMALATVGAAIIGVVTVSSLASVRRRMSYETWYFVHLTAYVGFAVSFLHQVTLGGDFADDTVARWFWILLHVAVALLLVVRRWGTTLRSVLRPLRVAERTRVAPDAVSLRLGGRGLRGIEAAPGQFFFLRPLRSRWWWQAHPFSLSAAPSPAGLRFTIKDRGDASGMLNDLPVGAAVAVEGPYGVTTPAVVGDRPVLFVAGGVGVAHTRALLEGLGSHHRPVVLFRAHAREDLIHLDEITELAEARGGRVLTLVGPSATLAVKDPFSADRLRRAVPDVRERVAILCGPERLVFAARAGLRAAGVASEDLHFEEPWW